MTAQLCVRCERPTLDGYACQGCADRAAAQLAEIRDMLPAARDIATGQARHGTGGGSGKPGSRLPFDLGATARLDAIQNELTTWARHIAEERGSQFVSTAFEGRTPADPLAEACSWLGGQMEWLRHRGEVDDYLTDVDAAVRVMRGLVRGPADKKFFGICGSEVGWDDDGQEFQRGEPCPGDVYGRPDAEEATCRACKARWGTAPRAEELGDKVREHAFSAKWIHEAYPKVNLKTLRSWANRGLLRTYWRTDADLTVEWTEPVVDPKLKGDELAEREAEVAAEIKARGPRLHYVGEVLDLAADDAARRETNRADRARRSAAKAAESEEAA